MKKLRGRPFGNRNNPSCKDVALVVQSYLDGELDNTDIAAVERHLDACRDCGMEAEMYETLKARIHARRRDVDPEIVDRLHAFTASMIAADPGSSPRETSRD